MTLALIDIVILAISVAATMMVGLSAVRSKRKGDHVRMRAMSATEYILAGRKLTAPLFAASLTATWYGSVLGAGEFIARYGVVFILCMGIPYYITAIIYAFLLSKRLRKNEAVSIPHLISRSFGTGPGYAAAIAMLFISIPAPFMLSIGLLFHSIAGVSVPVGVIIGSFASLFIVAKGGLASDVRANVAQLIIMFAGFGALAVWCIIRLGSIGEMWQHVPTLQQSIPGPLDWQVIAVWFLIALQTFVDPNFHVRSAAASTPSAARSGLMISVAAWMMFDGIQLLIGLYAVSYVPTANSAETFLNIANNILPMAWKGLFVAGVFAAIMSTLDGYALVSATTIGHDIIDSVRQKGHSRRSLLIGLGTTGIIGVVAAIAIPSIVDLIYKAASITVPALLLPIYVAIRKPHVAKQVSGFGLIATLWIVVPSCVALLTFFANALWGFGIEPMITGLIASLIIFFIIRGSHATDTGE
ncbi:MAG: hypothetical protein HYX66_02315 [Ignavibacteria bacterium]|nr:hypothetical protein [Ignavibacteria bacterium]